MRIVLSSEADRRYWPSAENAISLMKARWPPVSRSSAKSGSAASAGDAHRTASAANIARSVRIEIMKAPAWLGSVARGRLHVGFVDEFLDRHRIGRLAFLAP